MEEEVLFTMLALLVVLAAFTSILLSKLKLPSLIGFLVTGIIIFNAFGPSEDFTTIMNVFSDLGLVMLMFAIGLEINMTKLRTQGRFAITIAIVQVPVMLLVGMFAGLNMGYGSIQAITLGAVFSGASTAVVLAVLKTNNVLEKDKMDILVLVMIIEDISQVIMISMLTPVMKGGTLSMEDTIVLVTSITLFIVLSFAVGLKVIPKVLDWFYERSNDELISLLCIGLLFVYSLLAKTLGLSVAIGAFLSGAMVGMSKPKQAVERFVDPLKILFMGMFFISVGAKVSVDSLINNIPMILIIYGLFASCMFVAVNVGYWIADGDSRNGWISAISMCTMGEFAFIIAKQAYDLGTFDQSLYSSIIGAAIISMILLPVWVRYSERAYKSVSRACPTFLMRLFWRASRHRSVFYHGLSVVSNRSKEKFSWGLANAFFFLMMILCIELLFYFEYDPLSLWLTENFGMMDQNMWKIVILFVNTLLLLEPCRRLAKFMRLSLYILDRGKGHYRNDSPSSKVAWYEFISSLAIGAAMTVIIVILVPNGIDELIHIYVLLAVLALTLLYQYRRYKAVATKAEPA